MAADGQIWFIVPEIALPRFPAVSAVSGQPATSLMTKRKLTVNLLWAIPIMIITGGTFIMWTNRTLTLQVPLTEAEKRGETNRRALGILIWIMVFAYGCAAPFVVGSWAPAGTILLLGLSLVVAPRIRFRFRRKSLWMRAHPRFVEACAAESVRAEEEARRWSYLRAAGGVAILTAAAALGVTAHNSINTADREIAAFESAQARLIADGLEATAFVEPFDSLIQPTAVRGGVGRTMRVTFPEGDGVRSESYLVATPRDEWPDVVTVFIDPSDSAATTIEAAQHSTAELWGAEALVGGAQLAGVGGLAVLVSAANRRRWARNLAALGSHDVPVAAFADRPVPVAREAFPQPVSTAPALPSFDAFTATRAAVVDDPLPVAAAGTAASATETANTTAPEGWYLDPEEPSRYRWWTGRSWGPVA